MPAENAPLVLRAGQIVLADWRGDAMPKEPNKRRPAVVVEDHRLFAPVYPNVILVPLTEDAALAIPDLSIAIVPTAENGCTKPCWAVSHFGGHDLQGAPASDAIPRHRGSACRHPPPDRSRGGHRRLRNPSDMSVRLALFSGP
jgi:mRNA-degrading endonuclease toxin of MazEF toxin-antitoxin module